jgi:hypothetical protein
MFRRYDIITALQLLYGILTTFFTALAVTEKYDTLYYKCFAFIIAAKLLLYCIITTICSFASQRTANDVIIL